MTVGYDVGGETQLGLINAPKAGLTARALSCRPRRDDRWRSRARLRDALTVGRGHLGGADSHFSRDEVHRTARVIERLGTVVGGVRIVVSHAAATPMVRAGGGQVTTLTGSRCRNDDLDKIASNGLIHEELLSHLRDALR